MCTEEIHVLDPSILGVFLVASLVLLVMPGPTVMYIVARGIHQGRQAALVSALGVEVGTLIQLLVATLGLSVVMASYPVTFSVLKYLGAGYLVWLAVGTALACNRPVVDAASGPTRLRPVFLQGVLVEVLNPKTALFFLAFLPQFADPSRDPVALQILTLGLLFVLLAICNDGLIGLLAGTLGEWLRGNGAFLVVQRHVTGCVYTSLAINAALIGPGVS